MEFTSLLYSAVLSSLLPTPPSNSTSTPVSTIQDESRDSSTPESEIDPVS